MYSPPESTDEDAQSDVRDGAMLEISLVEGVATPHSPASVATASPDDEPSAVLAAAALIALLAIGAALKWVPVWRQAAASKSRRRSGARKASKAPSRKRRDRSARYQPVVTCDDDALEEEEVAMPMNAMLD